MTPERFETLAEAHGGAVARWPVAEREAAAAFMTAQPELARQMLGRAEALDALLDSWRPAVVSHALMESVIAQAPRAPVRAAVAWIWRGALGTGLAAACAAGLMMGVALSGATTTTAEATEPVSAAMTSYEGLTDTGGAFTTSALEGQA
ncbi:hypothetical protein [Phenylobacterium aquaticum]|uniref:hypothetical protein n=1 Tax=Phenylobacterium aquaticum TaxID=1763816 RepID=UPI0026F03F19|nr:hypothetical protein [Phenylobacterium aquaticum]